MFSPLRPQPDLSVIAVRMEPLVDRIVDIAIEVRKQAPAVAQKIPETAEKLGHIIEEGAQKVSRALLVTLVARVAMKSCSNYPFDGTKPWEVMQKQRSARPNARFWSQSKRLSDSFNLCGLVIHSGGWLPARFTDSGPSLDLPPCSCLRTQFNNLSSWKPS